MSTHSKWLLPSVITLALVSLGLLWSVMDGKPETIQKLTESEELGGDFALRNIDGKVALSDFRGKVVVVYFGFLSCPEVCPASMSVLKRSMEKLSPEHLASTQALLISIDPQRDDFQALAEFTRFYHPNIQGLTGSVDEVKAVTSQYGAFFEITESETVDSAYAYRHSSRYYIVDQSGALVQSMRHSTTPNEIAARIKKIFKQAG